MTLEQALIAALTGVVSALVYLWKLLWERSKACEADRDKQQDQIETLNRAVGIAEGRQQALSQCPQTACPWRPAAKVGALVAGVSLALVALTSCALPFARSYGFTYSPDGVQTLGANVHFDAAPPVARTAGPDDKTIKPPFPGAETLVVPKR